MYTKHDLRATLRRIEQAIYAPITELAIEAWVTPEPVPYAERQSGRHSVLHIGQSWGKLWDCAWFHFTGCVPESATACPAALSGTHPVK